MLAEPHLALKSFILYQNYPNPFNPETTITYQLQKSEKVNILIYDVLGKKVRDLENRKQTAGPHTVRWDGKDDNGRSLSSGIYICRMQAGEFNQSIKLMLIK